MIINCWSILSITLSTSEALRDDWDRRYIKIKIIIIIINDANELQRRKIRIQLLEFLKALTMLQYHKPCQCISLVTLVEYNTALV